MWGVVRALPDSGTWGLSLACSSSWQKSIVCEHGPRSRLDKLSVGCVGVNSCRLQECVRSQQREFLSYALVGHSSIASLSLFLLPAFIWCMSSSSRLVPHAHGSLLVFPSRVWSSRLLPTLWKSVRRPGSLGSRGFLSQMWVISLYRPGVFCSASLIHDSKSCQEMMSVFLLIGGDKNVTRFIWWSQSTDLKWLIFVINISYVK